MELFEEDKFYSTKDVKEKMGICRATLGKYCQKGLQYITLPGSKSRRFRGKVLNEFFKEV
jgi:hypothetical protein